MTYNDDIIDRYVMGDRKVVVVDLEITSLDEQGFENWDPGQYESGQVLEVWPVGRSGEIRQHVRWDRGGPRLTVTNIVSGAATAAGTNLGTIRFRVVMDR